MKESAKSLELPSLITQKRDGICYFTDPVLFDRLGVRIAFTWKHGGLSEGDYSGLNLATHVGDDPEVVISNRKLLMDALGAPDIPVLVPNQVHGDALISINSEPQAWSVIEEGTLDEGYDGIIVDCCNVSAMLCFADCVPVIIVASDGSFAVVHAGWRGVMARIAPKAVQALVREYDCDPEDMNVYIGPHIRCECFETSEDIAQKFSDEFGMSVLRDVTHVSLEEALRVSLVQVGVLPERIASVGVCTKCHPDDFYSYRASGGKCGRHAAVCFRKDLS